MTTWPLVDALRAGTESLYTLEAATGLIIAHGTWPVREDLASYIHHGAGNPPSTGITPYAH
jgi:hypothetical protein